MAKYRELAKLCREGAEADKRTGDEKKRLLSLSARLEEGNTYSIRDADLEAINTLIEDVEGDRDDTYREWSRALRKEYDRLLAAKEGAEADREAKAAGEEKPKKKGIIRSVGRGIIKVATLGRAG